MLCYDLRRRKSNTHRTARFMSVLQMPTDSDVISAEQLLQPKRRESSLIACTHAANIHFS